MRRRKSYRYSIADTIEILLLQSSMMKFMVKFRACVVRIQRSFKNYVKIREARISALMVKWVKLHPKRRLSQRNSQREEYMIPYNICRFFLTLYIKLKIWEYWENEVDETETEDLKLWERTMSRYNNIVKSTRCFSLFKDTQGLHEVQLAAMQNRFHWDKISRFIENVGISRYTVPKKIVIFLPDNRGSKASQELSVYSTGQPVEMKLRYS